LNFIEQLKETKDEYLFETVPYSFRFFKKGMKLIKEVHRIEIKGEKVETDEKVWLKRIIKTAKELELETSEEIANYISDIGSKYELIKREEEEYEIIFNGNIIDLHDQLSMDFNRVEGENFPILYEEKECQLEKKLDDYEFTLPKDTDELLKIGSKMSICVGSYGTRAKNKDCTIVIMQKKEKPIVCIEVNKNGEVRQAKRAFNRKPKDELAQVVKKWAEENNITWTTCPDLE
jgi:hypothetical protein